MATVLAAWKAHHDDSRRRAAPTAASRVNAHAADVHVDAEPELRTGYRRLGVRFPRAPRAWLWLGLLTLPWRLANAVHLLGKRRACDAGLDFYGRPTKAIWFHIPPAKRRRVVALLVGNVLCQWLTQLCRFVWSSYNASQVMPGVLWINLTFVGSILCGIVSGSLQGNAEGGVRKEQPGEFPPAPAEIALAAFRAERQRRKDELRLAGQKTLRGASASAPPPRLPRMYVPRRGASARSSAPRMGTVGASARARSRPALRGAPQASGARRRRRRSRPRSA